MRSTVQPLFHSARLQHFGDIMHECVDVLVARLEQAAAGDQSINLLDWLMELTLDVLGLSVFGVKFDNQVGNKPAIPIGLQCTHSNFVGDLPTFCRLLLQGPTPTHSEDICCGCGLTCKAG